MIVSALKCSLKMKTHNKVHFAAIVNKQTIIRGVPTSPYIHPLEYNDGKGAAGREQWDNGVGDIRGYTLISPGFCFAKKN